MLTAADVALLPTRHSLTSTIWLPGCISMYLLVARPACVHCVPSAKTPEGKQAVVVRVAWSQVGMNLENKVLTVGFSFHKR